MTTATTRTPDQVRAMLTERVRRAQGLRADAGRDQATAAALASLASFDRATCAPFVLQARAAVPAGEWFDVEACYSLASARAMLTRARRVWTRDHFRIIVRLREA